MNIVNGRAAIPLDATVEPPLAFIAFTQSLDYLTTPAPSFLDITDDV